MNKERLSFRDKLRTRILRSDPRSCSDGLDRTPIAVDRPGAECETPVQVKTVSLVDPRSPGGGVDRTPIVVEDEGIRRRVLMQQECDTPIRGQIPPAITIPGSDRTIDPLIIDSGEYDPRSPSNLQPRTPITSTPALDLITKQSSNYDTPPTVDLSDLKVDTERRVDKGQPSHILQNKFKSALSTLPYSDPSTPEAAGDLDSSDLSLKSSNDSSLVI